MLVVKIFIIVAKRFVEIPTKYTSDALSEGH
jgi:hypothetical protein